MTPLEKAEELVDKFRMNVLDYEGCSINTHKAIQCALIAVDEMIYLLNVLPYGMEYLSHIDYYEGVKQEIEKL